MRTEILKKKTAPKEANGLNFFLFFFFEKQEPESLLSGLMLLSVWSSSSTVARRATLYQLTDGG